jgi:hypothetical protein
VAEGTECARCGRTASEEHSIGITSEVDDQAARICLDCLTPEEQAVVNKIADGEAVSGDESAAFLRSLGVDL